MYISNILLLKDIKMETKVLKSQKFPKIKKLKKEYNIFRAIDTKVKKNLDIVEFINEDRVFRGVGTSTKKAFKSAAKEVVRHYNTKSKISA